MKKNKNNKIQHIYHSNILPLPLITYFYENMENYFLNFFFEKLIYVYLLKNKNLNIPFSHKYYKEESYKLNISFNWH